MEYLFFCNSTNATILSYNFTRVDTLSPLLLLLQPAQRHSTKAVKHLLIYLHFSFVSRTLLSVCQLKKCAIYFRNLGMPFSKPNILTFFSRRWTIEEMGSFVCDAMREKVDTVQTHVIYSTCTYVSLTHSHCEWQMCMLWEHVTKLAEIEGGESIGMP